ncbi:PLP-dependent aminotransferase family protein [soil metagenome]
MTAPLPLSAQSLRTADSPITYFIRKAIETEGLISLAAGLVDESAFPAAEVAEAVRAIMSEPASAQAALQYGSTQGFPALRKQVLERVCSADGVKPADVNLTADDVIITTGSQQMLYLLGECLFNPGDIVIAEAPSYFVYHSCLSTQGVKVLTVPMDDGGMDIDALAKLLAELELSGEIAKLKLIYTVDYFQNPTGLSLAADRRPRLLGLAKQYSKTQRILILEDAAYRELRYGVPDTVSVKRYDTTNEFVIYTSTFSKPCAPGLKTGYSIVPRDLVHPLLNLKGNHDFGSSNLNQHILSRLLSTGVFDRHVEKLRGVYARKRDALLSGLEVAFAGCPGVTWTKSGGGMYVWLRFPAGFDAGSGGPLVNKALAEGVLYIPGEFGHKPDATGHVPKNEVRLSFGLAEPEYLVEGAKRLAKAYRACGVS